MLRERKRYEGLGQAGGLGETILQQKEPEGEAAVAEILFYLNFEFSYVCLFVCAERKKEI